MTGAHIEAVAFGLIVVFFVWLSIAMKRRGVKNWWGYLVTLPLILFMAVTAAMGYEWHRR